MLAFVVAFIAALIGAPGRALACISPPYPDLETEMAKESAVFKGRVLFTEVVEHRRSLGRARIQVIEVRKGQLGDEVLVEYATGNPGPLRCPMVRLRVGEEDWFKAKASPVDGGLWFGSFYRVQNKLD
jgi:hypothetical protein